MSIFRFWGIPKERIGTYKKLVDERNDIVHSNGNIFYKDQQSIDNRITDVIRFCQEIQLKTKSTIEQSYLAFLSENDSVEESPYSTLEEMLGDEFISKHYISEIDMNLCCKFNGSSHNSFPNDKSMINIHAEIKKLYPEDE